MLQRLADLSRLLQLGALQHHGENHHFAPSMLALGLIFWNTQHAIDWNLLFTISSSSFSPSHSGDLQYAFENLKHSTFCWLKLTDSNSSFPPSHSGDLQPSDRHGSKVLGPVVHLPDWGFKIPFFQENLDKHFPRFHFFKKFLKKHFPRFHFIQKSSHPFHPLLGRGGSGQGDGLHQEPEGIQDLLPGMLDMIGNSWMQGTGYRCTYHI